MTWLATPLPLASLEPAAASHRPQLDALRANWARLICVAE